MNAAGSSSSKTLGMHVNTARRNSNCSEENDSRLTTSETGAASPIWNNGLSYKDLQRKVAEMEHLLKESRASNVKQEAELERVRAHAFKLSDKCKSLENRMFTLGNFISDEDIAFYTGFPSHQVFMATFNLLNPGENGQSIHYWHSVSMDVDPEYYEGDPELDVGPGRPRTLNAKEEFFLVMCRLRQGFAERHLGHLFYISQSTVSRIIISWVTFIFLRFQQLNIWPSQNVVDENIPQDFKNKYPHTRVIIDCAEVKCEMPVDRHRFDTTYMSSNLLKVNIGNFSSLMQPQTRSLFSFFSSVFCVATNLPTK